MRGRFRGFLLGLAALSFSAILLFSFRDSLLDTLGKALVNGQKPQKADAIVVLCGDYSGMRVLKAAELARVGFAPVVLMSGGTVFYGNDEPLVAAAFVARKGYDSSTFVPVPNVASSTVDEARGLVQSLRNRGVHKYLIVTNAFHSARAARIFHRLAPDMESRVVIAEDDSADWWKSRQGRKGFFFEATKTIADKLGI